MYLAIKVTSSAKQEQSPDSNDELLSLQVIYITDLVFILSK